MRFHQQPLNKVQTHISIPWIAFTQQIARQWLECTSSNGRHWKEVIRIYDKLRVSVSIQGLARTKLNIWISCAFVAEFVCTHTKCCTSIELCNRGHYLDSVPVRLVWTRQRIVYLGNLTLKSENGCYKYCSPRTRQYVRDWISKCGGRRKATSHPVTELLEESYQGDRYTCYKSRFSGRDTTVLHPQGCRLCAFGAITTALIFSTTARPRVWYCFNCRGCPLSAVKFLVVK